MKGLKSIPHRHQPKPLSLRQEALGIAGAALTIVDTCLKSGEKDEVAAKSRANDANRCIH